MSEFGVKMQRFATLTKQQLTDVCRKSIFDLCSSVVYSTPVATGQLRNNWFPSLTVPSMEQNNDTSPSGAEAIGRLQTGLADFQPGVDFWYSNNKPYAPRIEYEGYSAKAPEGMVRINVLRWQQIVENNAKGSK